MRPSTEKTSLARLTRICFGQSTAFHAHTDRHDRSAATLFHRAVVRRLAADWIEIPTLHGAEAGDRLPDPIARPHIDGVLGLPESDNERGSCRIV